jgi:hypothetical protein
MTEALISEVFKRPVLWDHRIKNYHNRDFVDKERRNLSQTLKISSKYRYSCASALLGRVVDRQRELDRVPSAPYG